jgi:hypothetical protein
MIASAAAAALLSRLSITDVNAHLTKLIDSLRPRPTPKALADHPLVGTRWISVVWRRRSGWSVLALSFVFSAGVEVFLAVSMNVIWPLPFAAAMTLMAGGCVVAALRER